VTSTAELTAALGQATPGSCVALSPGDYGQVSVPTGVMLLGRGAELVHIQGATLAAGSALRGMTAGISGVTAAGVGVRLDSVRISSSAMDGLDVAAGGSAIVTRSEIIESGRYGIRAFDAESVSLDASLVSGSRGPGVWVECGTGCSCSQPPVVTIRDVVLRDNLVVALSLVGAHATLERVEVRENPVGSDLEAAGGIVASQCSKLTAMGLRVLDNAAYGILIEDSEAILGDADGHGPVVSGNRIGIWCQNVGRTRPATVTIEGASVHANAGIGIGVDLSSSVTIRGSEVRQTSALVLPVLVNGSPGAKEVGDGISWLGASSVVLSGVTLGGNARASVLINGSVGSASKISNLVLAEGDELLGVLQQNLPAGGAQPTLGAGAPQIDAQSGEVFPVPSSPAVPPSI
jgi:hypothetical protein